MVNVPLKLLIAKELTTADEELLCEELDILLDEDSTVEDLAALTESSLEDERELGSNECVDDEKSELVANDKELAALDASVLDSAVLDIVLLSGEEDGLGFGDVVEPPPPHAVSPSKILVHIKAFVEQISFLLLINKFSMSLPK